MVCATVALLVLAGCTTSEERPVLVTVVDNFGGSKVSVYTQWQASYTIEETATEYIVTVTMPKPHD